LQFSPLWGRVRERGLNMKKTYISPALVAVQLGTCHMMAESLDIVRTGTRIQSSDEILTKENKDVNLWDEEW
jgi:hypothetical protein